MRHPEGEETVDERLYRARSPERWRARGKLAGDVFGVFCLTVVAVAPWLMISYGMSHTTLDLGARCILFGIAALFVQRMTAK